MKHALPSLVTAFLIACASSSLPAQAQHADVVPRVENGRIVTGGHEDATGEEFPSLRVFGYDFGEDPLDPYFAADPGFNAPAGSLPGNSQLRFDIPSSAAAGLPVNLSYWDGTGGVTFTAPASGETLRINLGAQNATLGSGTGAVAGFAIATATSEGSLHRHLNALLNGSDGNNDPADGNPPAGGIYVLSMELSSSDPAVAPSLPIYLVYNNGLSEEAHGAAIDFVRTNIIPEPGAATLLVLPLATLLRRRRNGLYAPPPSQRLACFSHALGVRPVFILNRVAKCDWWAKPHRRATSGSGTPFRMSPFAFSTCSRDATSFGVWPKCLRNRRWR